MSKRARLGLTLAAIWAVSAAGLLLLFVTPFPQTFSLRDAAIYDENSACSGIDTARGTTVSYAWTAPSFVFFFVVSCAPGGPTYSENGTSGSGSFVSVGGDYEFGASCSPLSCVKADVAGRFSGPLLQL